MSFLPPGSVYNAAGCRCTTISDLDALLHSKSDAILTKSCTLLPRAGNPHPKYYDDGTQSINSNGLENLGYKAYLDWYTEHRPEKPFILSVAGLCVRDNITIINAAQQAGVSAIELNLSCPNLCGVPVSYDLPEFNSTLQAIMAGIEEGSIPLGLKLPVYCNPKELEQVAVIVAMIPRISFIVCSNSLPNGLVYEDGSSRPDGENHPVVSRTLGGCGGGPLMKAIVLGQVYQFRKCLSKTIIACGGLSSRSDIRDALRAGANHCQIGTALMVHGTELFNELCCT